MSNYLAVATVTAILQRILQSAVQRDIDEVRVTTLQPRNIGNGTPETGINLFLYHVARNPALNNADATPFRSKGTPIKRQAAVDLYYMISFYGNDTELIPQRLLGSVVRTFNDSPTISAEAIQQAIADPTYRFLEGSNLANQVKQLLIVPLELGLDDLSKVRSVFFQAAYMLALVYKVTVVTIEGDESSKRALPISDRNLGGAVPFPNRPLVEQVMSEVGKLEPILANSTLLIRGKHLTSNTTLVRIGGFELSPSQVSETRITLVLTDVPVDFLRAGVQSLQVINQTPIGSEHNIINRTVDSNVAPFVLRPTIQNFYIERENQTIDESQCLRVQVDVMVGVKQRVVLIMNQWTINEPVGYQFEAEPRNRDTDTVIFYLTEIKSAEYLLRLQIDGAESLLTVDSDETSSTYGWFNAPKIEVE